MQPDHVHTPKATDMNKVDDSTKINISVTNSLYLSIASGTISNNDMDEDSGDVQDSRTELDSHANMPVLGRNSYVISHTGKTADVSPFSPEYEPMSIPIVDGAIRYECPYSGETYILVVRNALNVPAMNNNLIPPFMMREAGVIVHDTAKIHANDPTENDHSIYFRETGFRIPLSLWGVFSYFPTSRPTVEEMNASDNVYLLTPERWNPHHSAYAINEDNMLDANGNIIEKKHRQTVMLSEIEESRLMSSSLQISSIEIQAIDSIFESSILDDDNDDLLYHQLEEACLYDKMKRQADEGKYKCSIGSTNTDGKEYLINDDDTVTTEASTDDDNSDDESKDELFDDIYEQIQTGQIDIDAIMASATFTNNTKGVTAEHLSKIWRIDSDTAKRTLEVTTQHSRRTEDPKLAKNYGTNDRMLRYKRLRQYFFMDTFFATKKAKKSSRGHTCCQIFVTDKGFVYVIPMRNRKEVLQAVKQFAKEIGAPDAIICDAAREQKSLELRKFCNEIGTTLRVLEENTPWANKAELYIGLLKEAVRKDMRESNSPLAFWDYCMERRA